MVPARVPTNAAGGPGVQVLGPLTVSTAAGPVVLRGQLRPLLAWLAFHLGDGVDVDRLCTLLWEDDPPDRPARHMQRMVDRLAAALGPRALDVSRYRARLLVDPASVDAIRFGALLATPAGTAADREPLLREALGLWRGAPYPDLADHLDAGSEIRRLEGLHVDALEDLAALRLVGPVPMAAVVADLQMLTALHPDRTRLHQLLAVGLAKDGRRVEALRVLHGLRAASDRWEPDPWAALTESAIQTDDGRVLDQQLAVLVQG